MSSEELVPSVRPGSIGPPRNNPLWTITPQKRKDITDAFKVGASTVQAAIKARVAPATLHQLLTQGHKEAHAYECFGGILSERAIFYFDCMEAKVQFQMEQQDKVDRAAFGDTEYKIDPKLLDLAIQLRGKTDPEEYGNKAALKIESKTAISISLEERSGSHWQMGNVRASQEDVIDTAYQQEGDDDA